jgi:two-component system alkaline phosphatase synthesis response regulator PhoP
MATRVFVVDDEPDIVELLSHNLECEGFQVFRATAGMEALNEARKHLPDLILLDLMLPDLDGFSICEILRCQPSTAEIPVILLTAMAGELPRLHGFESGAADYCVKPVRMADLKQRIRCLIEARDARLENETRNAEPAMTR